MGSGESFDLEAAIAGVRGRGPALVLMHDNPDPDAMAAAEGLRVLLQHRADVEVTVGRAGLVGRPENRAMATVLGLRHTRVSELELAAFPIIALVDTQPETGNNSLPVGHSVDIIVDHHPRQPGAARAPWCDIRQDYGASTTIVHQYLRQAGVPLTEALATAFLYAIKSETRDLGRETSDHEFEAYTQLIREANLEWLHAISEPKVPAAHFAALDRALRAAEVRGSLVAANLGTLDYPDLVAEIADLLLPYERAHWVLCAGQHQGSVYLSLRTDVTSAHAGELMRSVVGRRGSAGGHGQVAGGRLRDPVGSYGELASVCRSLFDRLAALLGLDGETAAPLLPPRV
jgi:nanoRNase/pAp phosphatase (c-di-AMP/oligoRNAs hydrolase)